VIGVRRAPDGGGAAAAGTVNAVVHAQAVHTASPRRRGLGVGRLRRRPPDPNPVRCMRGGRIDPLDSQEGLRADDGPCRDGAQSLGRDAPRSGAMPARRTRPARNLPTERYASGADCFPQPADAVAGLPLAERRGAQEELDERLDRASDAERNGRPLAAGQRGRLFLRVSGTVRAAAAPHAHGTRRYRSGAERSPLARVRRGSGRSVPTRRPAGRRGVSRAERRR
jgi:hypothetical protein